jgi:hypothetical protein
MTSSGQSSEPQPDTDQSLKTEGYILLGFPAPDRVWSGADMIQANKVLASFSQDKTEQLPKYKSPRSGEVFARLTSTESLPSFRNRGLPLQTRLALVLDYADGLKEIMKRYTLAFLNNKVRNADVVELCGAFLRVQVVQLDLVDAFVSTLDKEDPKYDIRMEGMEQMKFGLTQVTTGMLMTLSERHRYRSSDLIRLVGYMQETWPMISCHLPPAARANLLTRLQQMQDDSTLQDLQPGLRQLYDKVRDAINKRKSP